MFKVISFSYQSLTESSRSGIKVNPSIKLSKYWNTVCNGNSWRLCHHT